MDRGELKSLAAEMRRQHNDGNAPWLHSRDIAAIEALASEQGEAVDSPEDRYEHFVREGIANSPEPLRELGEYLSRVLDEDEWPNADRLLLQLAATPPAQVSDADWMKHPQTVEAKRQWDAVANALGADPDDPDSVLQAAQAAEPPQGDDAGRLVDAETFAEAFPELDHATKAFPSTKGDKP